MGRPQQELAIDELTAGWDKVLDRVAGGETIRIIRDGRPVAMLVPCRADPDRPIQTIGTGAS